MYVIKELPKLEQPRERLLEYGSSSLSNKELLAIILRVGTKDKNVLELSNELLIRFSSLNKLINSEINDLIKIKGIGLSKAITLKAMFELSKRIQQEYITDQCKLNHPKYIYEYLKLELSNVNQEYVYGLYLSSSGHLIKKVLLFKGTLNQSVIHPREVFKYAIIHSAAAFVLVHNHPSGHVIPSKDDIEITKVLYQTSKIMNILFVDHVIIGKNKYYSFKESSKVL